jgi:radical SAM protein with 4Fe4S-binding SPASM domain
MSDTLLARVLDRAARLGTPLTAHLDLTYRCNERCTHCYLEHASGPELTTVEVTGILEQLAAAGTFFLVLSGGEIFLRHDLFEILAAARKLRFSIRLKTNGTLINADVAGRLKPLALEEVDISLYSHLPATHDAVTLLPGSFAKSLAAIRHLRANDIKVLVAFLLTRQNHAHFDGVRQLASELGARCSLDLSVTPRIDGDNSVLRYRATREQLIGTWSENSPTGASLPGEALLDALPCKAGHSSIYINPYGRVYPCVTFPLLCGDLRRESFSEVWQNSKSLHLLRSIRWRDLPACAGCRYAHDCSRCPGLAFLEGSMWGPSQVDCQKSELRSQLVAFGAAQSAVPKSGCERS